MMARMRSDEGSGTMAGVLLVIVIAVMLATVACAGNLLVCRSKARSSADVTAVSAASALQRGADDPCVVARHTAQANDTELESCAVAGEDVTVTVAKATRVPFASQMRQSSRAGPVDCND